MAYPDRMNAFTRWIMEYKKQQHLVIQRLVATHMRDAFLAGAEYERNLFRSAADGAKTESE